MSGGTERRQCETCCENRLFSLSLSLSRVFLLAFTSFVSFHNFVSSNARQITAATFLSRPWGTLPTLRYYNETRSRIRKMCIYVYILSELLPLHLPFSLFHFSTSSVGYFSTSSLLSFAVSALILYHPARIPAVNKGEYDWWM